MQFLANENIPFDDVEALRTVEVKLPFHPGDTLSLAEFLRRWKQHPEIKFAELIGGIVYMPSPLSLLHGVLDRLVSGWLYVYQTHTPGTEGGNNAATLMEDNAPQPDGFLRVLPEYGGQSHNEGIYLGGAVELIVEVCVSSASYDLHPKFDLYERAGVPEYLAILMQEREIRWHRLGKKGYQLLKPQGGIWKSRIFPGLWLDGAALLSNDSAQMLTTLQQGLQSPEHAALVTKLARKRIAKP